jgi:hypothetical protein
MRIVLVVVQPQRLLTRVPLGRRVRLVATDTVEGSLISAETDFDAAIAFTQDARRLVPLRWTGGLTFGGWIETHDEPSVRDESPGKGHACTVRRDPGWTAVAMPSS